MSDDRITPQDPRSQYPKPPFKEQPQPSPGLGQKMDPVPDCGETSYQGSGKLKGRKALITGGDSGIGRAVAIAIAREGADVAIGYLPAEEADAKQVIALIEKAGQKAVAIPGDITNESFCSTLVEIAVKQLGGLDILVNNAANQTNEPDILDVTTDAFDKTLKTNLYALFWIIKAAIPHLKPGSAIVNSASVQAYHPSTGITDYAMTKAGIVDFHQGFGQAAPGKRHPHQCRRSRPVLDSPAIQRRHHSNAAGNLRHHCPNGPPRPACGDCSRLCPSRLSGSQLHHRRSVWRYRWGRHCVRTHPAFQAIFPRGKGRKCNRALSVSRFWIQLWTFPSRPGRWPKAGWVPGKWVPTSHHINFRRGHHV